MIKMAHNDWKVEMYLDLHGHSRLKDAFMYANIVDSSEPQS